MIKKQEFLKTKGTQIVHGDKPFILKGINLGGWLMMEAYILHAPNFPEHQFKQKFERQLGSAALRHFEEFFRSHFIQEKDFARLARIGFNCVRVPFNCRLIEEEPFIYNLNNLKYLDKVVKWAAKYRLWIILDLHAAPGAQNHDWHSDSDGRADLWRKKENRQRVFELWKFIADRYKDEPWVAGYDLLNEAVMDDTKMLNCFYKEAIKHIRRVDRNHLLFIEGNTWATDIGCLEDFEDDNYVLSVHFYQPWETMFNLIPQRKYHMPQKTLQQNRRMMSGLLKSYADLARKRKRPVFVGEFGVNARQGISGEDQWLVDTLTLFNKYDFHWTYWTYKAIKNYIFPDGLFSYIDNSPWVNRQGPLTGWDTYPFEWPSRQKDIISSWHTENFKVNQEVLKSLQKFL